MWEGCPSPTYLLAPPTVGTVAYLNVTHGAPDVVAYALIGYGLLQLLVLIRALPWVFGRAFTPAAWAFTFGLTALATSMLRLSERGDHGPIALMAPYALALATVSITIVSAGSLWLLSSGHLPPPRDLARVSKTST